VEGESGASGVKVTVLPSVETEVVPVISLLTVALASTSER